MLPLLAGFLSSPLAWADGAAHGDPVAHVLLALAVILVAAKLGGDVATRLGQPAVLGELLMGVLIGNMSLFGFHGFDGWKHDAAIDMLSRVGVVILLFEVGLESTVKQMLQVGVTSLVVAVLGVVAPFGLGWAVSAALLPNATIYVHMFIGATLTATSVGITARVFQDLGRSQTGEARVILGAAVIDDVLGLIILAVVIGIIAGANTGGISVSGIAVIVVKATGFLVIALAVGVNLSPYLFSVASKLRARGVLLAVALAFCFGLSWLANLIGLAPIVGAFAAGLVLEEVHFRDFADKGEHPLEHLVRPIASFLVPVFFVVMGLRTDLRSFAQPGVLGLAAALTLAAIVGKQVCALGVLRGKVDPLTVGLGMVPRGEVGLIFANIGLSLQVGGQRVVDPATFSAVVVMVIVTTLVTPMALKWSLARLDRRRPAPALPTPVQVPQ